MVTFISIIHVMVALVLIVLVLLQDSKGGGMGMLSGGGSSTVFGASGATNFLATMTKWIAILFAGTCLYLTIFTASQTKSVVDSLPAGVAVDAPVETAPATSETNKATSEK
ncbi:MAG: preprotein translocase subunit SecG [Bdellovibrionales bacterium]